MATYNICGIECNFYNIPHATLATYLNGYGVTPRTHILAWETPCPILQIAITSQVLALHTIGAVEVPPLLVEDGRRTAYLLENPNQRLLEMISEWIRIIGVKYLSENPYRRKRGEVIDEMDEKIRLEPYKRPSYAYAMKELKAQTMGQSALYEPTKEDGTNRYAEVPSSID